MSFRKPTDKRASALRRFAFSISAFTVAGAFFLHFEDSWAQPVVALASCYTLELLLETLDAFAYARAPRYRGGGLKGFVDFMLPAHITGLSTALLLYSNAELWPIVFACTVAEGSKFLLQVPVNGRRRHFMNPSNLGISTTLLLFPWVGISPPYQFTEGIAAVTGSGIFEWLLPAFVLAAGTAINAMLTGKWPLILGWVGGFAAQALIRSTLFGTPLVAPLMPLTGLVFVIYTNYMITDPGTTPFARRNQVLFGLSTAAVYGVLVSFHVVFGLFFALTIVCACRGGLLYSGAAAAALASRSRVRVDQLETEAART